MQQTYWEESVKEFFANWREYGKPRPEWLKRKLLGIKEVRTISIDNDQKPKRRGRPKNEKVKGGAQ